MRIVDECVCGATFFVWAPPVAAAQRFMAWLAAHPCHPHDAAALGDKPDE